MKVNGKSKTPITAAQSRKNSGEGSKSSNGKPGGTKARASKQTSKSQMKNGVTSTVLERISDGILALDAGMNYTYLNERAGELLGRRAEDLVGKNLQEEYPEPGKTPFMEACQRALATQSVVWLNEYFPPTGRWLEGRIYPSQDGVSVLFSEAAERRISEEERIEELSMLPEQNPDPVLRLTSDAKILYANRAAASLVSEWKEQGEQAPSLILIRELLPQVLKSASNRGVEIEHLGKVFLCLFVPVRERDYVNLYFRDITDRVQAEEALRSLINQTSAGIARTDRQGKFIFANEVLCQMLGYSKAELTGMTVWEVTEKEILEKNKKLFKHLLGTGEGYLLEIRMIRRNGSMIWASVGVEAVRDSDGRIRGTTAVIVDITRRKQAEESLLDSARRSLFLSSLSDTIRSIESPSKIAVEAACLLGGHLKVSRVAYAEIQPDGTVLIQDNYTDGVPEMTGRFSMDNLLPRDQAPRFQT